MPSAKHRYRNPSRKAAYDVAYRSAKEFVLRHRETFGPDVSEQDIDLAAYRVANSIFWLQQIGHRHFNTKHGHAARGGHTGEYQSWVEMIRRCYSPNKVRAYANYGGRGITVCKEWLDSFESFIRDMGPRPAGHSLERIDNNGNYEPSNCRWATPKEQARNRRNSVRLTINGRTMVVSAWAEEAPVCAATIYERLSKGWSAHEAVFLTKAEGYKKRIQQCQAA
jgi:hypothetical protein